MEFNKLTSSEMFTIRGGGDGGETRTKDIFDFVEEKKEGKISNMSVMGRGSFDA